MDADFLLTRGQDLVVLGVRLHGFEASADGIEVTAGEGARIVLHLPPQHVLEETMPTVPTNDFVARSQLAEPSRVAYDVAGGTQVRLDGESILRACTRLAPAARPPGLFDTAIELPWRLVFAPDLTVGAQPQHAPTALSSPGGVVGLWLTRLIGHAGAGASSEDALALLPVDSAVAGFEDPPGVSIALNANARSNIVVNGQAQPPRSGPVELTALGGSLSVHGEWEGFRWSHRAALGRDQAVVVVEQFCVYPFGPRGILTTTTVRDPDTELPGGGSTVPPGGTLALRKVRTIQFTAPVVHAEGPVFSRAFPFSEVELTTTSFAGLGEPEPSYSFHRPTPELEGLREKRGSAEQAMGELEEQWLTETTAVTMDDLVRSEFEPAVRWSNLSVELAQAREADSSSSGSSAALSGLQTRLEEAERNLAQLEAREFVEPDGSVSPAVKSAREGVDALRAQVRDAEAGGAGPDPGGDARVAELENAVASAYTECERYLRGDRTVEELAAAENQAAIDWLAKRGELPTLTGEIETLERLAATSHEVSVWPTNEDGSRMRFPVRLRRGDQIVDVSMPLLLVKDFTLPAEASVPAYASLEDPALAGELDRAWSEALIDTGEEEPPDTVSSGTVAVPGLLLDVVGSASPKPEDVQVIRALNIFGAASGDPFVPSLGRSGDDGRSPRSAMWVDLPAVRTLLGAATPAPSPPPDASVPPASAIAMPSGTPVSFAAEYLDRGEAAKLLFATDREIGVDCTSAADRSGGLTALQLAADGISRERGPVQAAALTSDDPAQAVGAAATLLGFKLQDLLHFKPQKPGQLPDPPAIVSELADGAQPVVRMAWIDRPLKDCLALKAFPTDTEPGRHSLLSLEVTSAPDSVKTTGDVRDFMLVFPPTSKPLLQLSFAKLAYAQETSGGVASPPRVTVEGFDVKFLGPLELLEDLQDAVDLGVGPKVQPTPSGVTATFSVPVPSVQCAAFSLSNLVFRSAVEVPFNGDPVAISIGFASRAAPFAVSVLAFSGGGYIDIRIDAKGPRIEASLEFGAAMSVNFLVAKGEIHALGGVRYLQQGDSVELTGYVRIGGSVEVLGLVSASIELVVQLSYESTLKRLEGRATLVLELDLTLWSDSVEIDSGPWVLQGGDGPAPAERVLPVGERFDDDAVFEAIEAQPAEEELAAWRSYRQALAGRGGGGEG
jgi:hypothetical protein